MGVAVGDLSSRHRLEDGTSSHPSRDEADEAVHPDASHTDVMTTNFQETRGRAENPDVAPYLSFFLYQKTEN